MSRHRAGTVELRISKLRRRSYFPGFLEPRRCITTLHRLPRFDDFNEDLRRLGAENLRASVRQQLDPQDVVRFMSPSMTGTG